MIRKEHEPPKSFEWKTFQGLPPEMPRKKLYVSSAENQALAEFKDRWDSLLEIDVLEKGNFQKALSQESDGILVYDADIFPDCPKISVQELHDKLWQGYVSESKRHYMVTRDFISMRRKDLDRPERIAEMLDNDYLSVFICNEDGAFLGSLDEADLRGYFPGKLASAMHHTSVAYEPDGGKMKAAIASSLLSMPKRGRRARSLAILHKKKVVAAGEFNISTGNGEKDFRRRMPAH